MSCSKKTDKIRRAALEKAAQRQYKPQGYKIARPITELDPATGEYMPANSKLIDFKERDDQLSTLHEQIEQERREGQRLRRALSP